MFWDFCVLFCFSCERGKFMYVILSRRRPRDESWGTLNWRDLFAFYFNLRAKCVSNFESEGKIWKERSKKKEILSEISLDSSTQLKGNSSSFEVTMRGFRRIWKSENFIFMFIENSFYAAKKKRRGFAKNQSNWSWVVSGTDFSAAHLHLLLPWTCARVNKGLRHF